MSKNNIHILLGHNGAGKSTLFKVLINEIDFDSGSIIYDNKKFNIYENNVGYCPAENYLYDNLTVKQHLIFFRKLKNLKKSKIQ